MYPLGVRARSATVTGEDLVPEQRIGATARAAELAIAQLAVVGRPPCDAGPELAEARPR